MHCEKKINKNVFLNIFYIAQYLTFEAVVIYDLGSCLASDVT